MPFKLCFKHTPTQVGLSINDDKIHSLTLNINGTKPQLLDITVPGQLPPQDRQKLPLFFKPQRMITSLPLNTIMIKEMVVDEDLTDQETYFYLKQQAAQLLHQKEQDLYLDYAAIPANSSLHKSADSLIKLCTFAIAKEKVSQHLAVCQQKGFIIAVMDIDALALLRTLPFLSHYSHEKNQAILWLNPPFLTLCALEKEPQRYYFKSTRLPLPPSNQSPEATTALQTGVQQIIQFFINAYSHVNISEMITVGFTELNIPLNFSDQRRIHFYPAMINPAAFDSLDALLHKTLQQHLANLLICLGLALWKNNHEY